MNIYIYKHIIYTHINTYLNKTTLISKKSSYHILPYCFRIAGEVEHLKKIIFEQQKYLDDYRIHRDFWHSGLNDPKT